MKNIITRNTDTAFFPVGFEIAEDEIFDSPRNLGLSLMSALTGMPIECLQVGNAEISIGLGCFSLIGISCPEYQEGDDIETITDMAEAMGTSDDWDLMSSIRYDLYTDPLQSQVLSRFSLLNFNIMPSLLLRENSECFDGIQFFGPGRLLKRLKSNNWRLYINEGTNRLDLINYLEGGMEPNDAILSPPEEEYELYWETKDPEDKFRVLLNMITTFASTLSAKLMQYGHVIPSSMYWYSDEMLRELCWLKGGKLDDPWKPPMKLVERFMKEAKMSKRDMDPKVVKLLWPKNKVTKRKG